MQNSLRPELSGKPIGEFLNDSDISQLQFSRLFRLSQTAISKMVRSQRRIEVVPLPEGGLELRELRIIARYQPDSLSRNVLPGEIPKQGCEEVQH